MPCCISKLGEPVGERDYALILGRWRILLSDLERLDELLQTPRPRLVDVRMARLVVAGCVEFAYYDTPANPRPLLTRAQRRALHVKARRR